MKKRNNKNERATNLWTTTFADLMTLLMCFFVLLVAFSELNVNRYRQLSGSMRDAFGVQQRIEAEYNPKGNQHVVEETGPAKAEPDSVEEASEVITEPPQPDEPVEAVKRSDPFAEKEPIESYLESLHDILEDQIEEGSIELQEVENRVVIRIEEKGAFRSGKAKLAPEFASVLDRLTPVLASMSGVIEVAGHTDDRPIHNRRFRSNWDLSTGRAVSVVHQLLGNGLDPASIVAQGYADSRPLLPNDTDVNRAHNRRVEISVIREERSLPL